VRAFVAIEADGAFNFGEVRRHPLFEHHCIRLSRSTPHVTLLFFADISSDALLMVEEEMDAVAGVSESFSITCSGIGFFPSASSPRVIWAGISDEGAIETLRRKLVEGLQKRGIEAGSGAFHPHVTLARVSCRPPSTHVRDLLHKYAQFEFGRDTVRTLLLKKSTLGASGPVHETLHTSRLGQ